MTPARDLLEPTTATGKAITRYLDDLARHRQTDYLFGTSWGDTVARIEAEARAESEAQVAGLVEVTRIIESAERLYDIRLRRGKYATSEGYEHELLEELASGLFVVMAERRAALEAPAPDPRGETVS